MEGAIYLHFVVDDKWRRLSCLDPDKRVVCVRLLTWVAKLETYFAEQLKNRG